MTENAEKIQELVGLINEKQELLDNEWKALIKTLDSEEVRNIKLDIVHLKEEANKIIREDIVSAFEYFENSDLYMKHHDLLNEAQAVIFTGSDIERDSSSKLSQLSGTAERILSVYVILAMQNIKQERGISIINNDKNEKIVIYNPEKLYFWLNDASKDYLLPEVSKIVDRKSYEKALLKGFQNEWDTPRYNNFGKVSDLVAISSFPLFQDVASGRIKDLSIIGKKFKHGMFENTKGLDAVEKIWGINNTVANYLDPAARDKIGGIVGVENLIYQVGNGGLDQYFFNGYHKNRDFTKQGPLSYGVADLSDFIIDKFAPRMDDLGMLNCREQLVDFAKQIKGLTYVDNPKDLAEDFKQNLVESYIEGLEIEDLYNYYSGYIGGDISIYSELIDLAEENSAFEDLSDFDDVATQYPQWNDLPDELQELLYSEIEHVMNNYGYRIAEEMADDSEVLDDAINTSGERYSYICEELYGEYWPIENVSQLENTLYDLEEAIAPVVNQMAEEIIDSEQYKSAVTKANQRNIYVQKLSADEYKKEARAVAKGDSGKTHDTKEVAR